MVMQPMMQVVPIVVKRFMVNAERVPVDCARMNDHVDLTIPVASSMSVVTEAVALVSAMAVTANVAPQTAMAVTANVAPKTSMATTVTSTAISVDCTAHKRCHCGREHCPNRARRRTTCVLSHRFRLRAEQQQI